MVDSSSQGVGKSEESSMDNGIEILIVEDSRTQAIQLQHMLEQHQFQVSWASNGKDALEAIRGHRPTIVISDIVMPEMDGYQLCRQIREDPQLKDLPVILMTTLTKPREVIKALESKADNFITKPCQEEFLLSRIEYILANQELRSQAGEAGEDGKDGRTRILYAGQQHTLTSDPVQIVDLLLSTFDNALQKNRELERSNRELTKAQLALRKLNEQLEDIVEARTQALALSEENHRALLENNADAIIVVDQNAAVRFVNPAAETLLQRSADDLLHTTLDFPIIVGETREVPIPRKHGERIVTEMRTMQTLWEGEAACVATLRDITLRKHTEATLQRAKEAAEAADQAKSEFLANMSHEIRTPMNGIIGMTGLLLDTPLSAEQHEHAAIVQDCSSSLLGIINEILDFSKIETGKLDLETLDFDLHTTIDEVTNMFAAEAEERGLVLTRLIHHNVPMILSGDPGRLRQILVNLLENALKFTERGEIILQITLDRESQQANQNKQENQDEACLRFAVSDTGIGIPTNRLNQLFQPFSQVDSSSTRKYGGTGLGLALCQELTQLMGGMIGVDSQLGRGSIFWFTMPFAKRMPPVLPVSSMRSDLQGLIGLVVDPNQTNRTILQHQMSSWGMHVHTAQDGRQALDMLLTAAPKEQEGQAYDVVILDWQMPGMDGLELARAIRTTLTLNHVRLVLLTAAGKRGDGAKAHSAGINAYLTKPVNELQLYDCLRTVMEQEPVQPNAHVLITQHTLAEVHNQSQPRLLVVEDNLVNQKLLVRLLEKLGYRADVAPNGQEALDALERTAYTVVLMDCQLPVMDGYEATVQIRERDQRQGRHTPIIAVTAHDTPDDEARCLGVGMDAYLPKPIHLEALRSGLAPWLPLPTASQSATITTPHPWDSLQDATQELVQNIDPEPIPELIPELIPEQEPVRQQQQVRVSQREQDEQTEGEQPGQDEPLAPIRVLVTEDNIVNQKLAVRLLEKMGYQADIAINGKVAVDVLAQQSYDIILMDCQMPEMDGFEATAHIRKSDQQHGRHTPIIALTAHAIEGDRERCLAAGMDDYVSKPINPGLLKAALARWKPEKVPLIPSVPGLAPVQAATVSIPDDTQPDTIPAPAIAPLLDLEEALSRVDGDRAFLNEMAEIFLNEYPHFLAQIQTAIANENCEVLTYAAHTLKGSVGNFVDPDSVEAAQTLERIGRQGDLSEAPLALARLEAALNRLTPALSNLKTQLAA